MKLWRINSQSCVSSATHGSRAFLPLERTSCLLWGSLLISALSANTAFGQSEMPEAKNTKRCATRLANAFFGEAPDANLSSIDNPQSAVEQLVNDPRLNERFASFVNFQFNVDRGANSSEDAVYHLAKHVLQNKLPWKDLFVGPYNVVATVTGQGMNRTTQVSVQNDPQGLGYFRSTAWLQRYAGNEPSGIKINTAYRMLNNVLGLTLTATTSKPEADISATGRRAPECKGCHYDGWYGLDNTAEVLGRVVRQGQQISFTPPDGQPKPVLGGMMAKDDKELITLMVESDQFAFNACRVVFRYLYGREENACEAAVFDQCFDAFKKDGMIQSAIAAVAKDQTFCQD